MLKKVLRNKPPSPLRSMKELEYLLGSDREVLIELAENVNAYYHPFIKVVGDKKRHIDNPTGKLKRMQQLINKRVLADYTFPDYVTGGRRGYSAKDNAKIHLNKSVVIRIDIRACYPSTTDLQVFRVFKDYFECSDKIAGLLTRLTTYRKYLPQGASTSSTLINLALMKIYAEIYTVARKNGATFGAYVDDVCVSGDRADKLVENIIRVIQKGGYAVRNEKIKIMRRGSHQEITGITVNKKLSVPREKMKRYIKAMEEQAPEKITAGMISYVNSINKKQGEVLSRKIGS